MTALLAALVVAQASNVEFKGVTYSAPEAWKVVDANDVRTVTAPPQAAGEFLMISLTPARDASADPEADLTAHADTVDTGARRFSRGKIEKKTAGSLSVYAMTADVEQKGFARHTRLYQLVSDGRRSTFVVAFFRGKKTIAAHQADLVRTLSSVRLVASPADAGSR